MSVKLDRATAVLMAIKLVEPGQQKDIAVGLRRLFSFVDTDAKAKSFVDGQLLELRSKGLVRLYYGSRYMLTAYGKAFVARTELWDKLESRRIFLLKETRKRTDSVRSSARDGSL